MQIFFAEAKKGAKSDVRSGIIENVCLQELNFAILQEIATTSAKSRNDNTGLVPRYALLRCRYEGLCPSGLFVKGVRNDNR